LLVTVGVFAVACSDDKKPSAATTTAGATSTSEARAEGTCPLTIANRTAPPNSSDWGHEDSHGNGKLWTLFWPHNVVIADSGYIEDDGSIRMKWPWWRGVPGTLSVTGRRIDGPGRPLRFEIPEGYGKSGFQPSSLYFSTEGCWEVTGHVGNTSLTFVTLVVKASTYSLELKTS